MRSLLAALAVLLAVPAVAETPEAEPSFEPVEAPSASPLPSPSPEAVNLITQDALSGLPEAVIKKCVETTNRWQDLAAQAQTALGGCLFHRFHKACKEAHQISLAEQGARATCREVMKRKHIQFPDMNCVIVHVPDHCGKE